MGPFVFQFFKRYKGQDTQTIILPISAFFLVLLMLKVFSCFLLLFYLLLCVTFYWIDTKNDTKNNKSSPGSVSGAMFGRVFFLYFFLSILKGVKAYFINILQYVIFRSHFFTNIVQAYFKHTFPKSFIHEIAFLPATRLRVWKILTYFRAPKMTDN